MPVFLSLAEPRARGEAINERRSVIVRDECLPEIRGFHAVRDLFEALERRGRRIALASSAKGEELAAYKRKADIEDLIAEKSSMDDAERSKPHGDMFQAALDRLGDVEPAEVVVDDTPYDAAAAAKVGLRTVGVLCGGFTEAQSREAGCVAAYHDPADLLAHLDDVLALC